jgi:hypothetical protein
MRKQEAYFFELSHKNTFDGWREYGISIDLAHAWE